MTLSQAAAATTTTSYEIMLSAATTTTATVGPVATDSGQFCMKVAQGVLVVVVIVNKVLSFVFLGS